MSTFFCENTPFISDKTIDKTENDLYLTSQIITYIGNKRSLLDFIGLALEEVQSRLDKKKLRIFDVFSGSGIVSRYFKQYASFLIANDLEKYSYIINNCYLSNEQDRDIVLLRGLFVELKEALRMAEDNNEWTHGIISDNYAPQDDANIKKGERVFYTTRNALYLDTARKVIGEFPKEMQDFFLAPLLALASVHTNTSGVFKGFYKNSETGIGQYGGKGKNALSRIIAAMDIQFPVFSNFNCETMILQGDANTVIDSIDEVDLAYIDPPYNQHPYGSNYFMLNVVAENKMSPTISKVSGISSDWNRSVYNKAQSSSKALEDLIARLKARFVLISFNSEGFISIDDMKALLVRHGTLTIYNSLYNTFRGSRNLQNRKTYVTEYLFLLEKK